MAGLGVRELRLYEQLESMQRNIERFVSDIGYDLNKFLDHSSTAPLESHLNPSTAPLESHLNPSTAPLGPHLNPSTAPLESDLNPSTAPLESHLNPSTAPLEPHSTSNPPRKRRKRKRPAHPDMLPLTRYPSRVTPHPDMLPSVQEKIASLYCTHNITSTDLSAAFQLLPSAGKLELYEHLAEQNNSPADKVNLSDLQEGEDPAGEDPAGEDEKAKTRLELIKLERDSRRRRQKFKGGKKEEEGCRSLMDKHRRLVNTIMEEHVADVQGRGQLEKV